MTALRLITIESARKLIDEHTQVVDDEQLVRDPLISICLLTYNHQSFIRQALDGVSLQETSVPVEIVIADDASEDGTTDIILDFQRKYPGTVRVLLAKQNLGCHTGNGRLNFIRALRACRGKYIALLDGDDYWIAHDKIQKQFEALEAHPDWAVCFHRTQVVNEQNGRNHELPGADASETSTLTDILAGNFMATAAVMFRNGLIAELPQWYYDIRIGDWPLHVLHAQYGDIGLLPETMSVHRIHENGVFSAMDDGERWRVTHEVFDTMRENLEREHGLEFAEAQRRLMARMFHDMSELGQMIEACKSSVSWRVGRFLTWPLRFLLQPFLKE